MIKQNDIENIINSNKNNLDFNIDWSKAWSKKYHILKEYKERIDISKYEIALDSLLKELKENYSLTTQDAMLILKDILYNEFKKLISNE